jgi:UDP-glucuronate 4-epimerase
MALFRFTENILNGNPIDIFNFGHHRRDFTYVDDIVAGITSVLDRVPLPNPDWSGSAPDPGTSSVPYRLYNMGNQRPIDLIHYIEVLENCLGRKAKRNLLPKQPGDMLDTWADVEDLVTDVGYCPDTSVEDGVQYFVDWYVDYYNVKL